MCSHAIHYLNLKPKRKEKNVKNPVFVVLFIVASVKFISINLTLACELGDIIICVLQLRNLSSKDAKAETVCSSKVSKMRCQ